MGDGWEIDELLWDEYVVAHIARHDVTAAEVEEVVFGAATEWETQAPPPRQRLIAIGPTAANAKRILVVVCEMPSSRGTTVVVTARPATAREKRVYQERRNDDEQS